MKKIICIAVSFLLLFTGACAEEWLSIREMEQPPRWTQTCQVGKSTVAVAVQPTIPRVEALPVLKVAPAFWVPQPAEDAPWVLMDPSRVAEDAFSLWTENVETVSAGVRTTVGSGFVYAPLDDDEKYIIGSDLTLGWMKATVADIFAAMKNPDHAYTTNHIGYLNPHTSKKGYAFFMNFHQALRGAPLWGHAIYSVSKPADSDMSYWPGFTLTMQDDGNYELSGRVVKETAVLAEDIPLCGFDKVKATVEQQMKAGHIRAVYGIDLGYALYNEPGKTHKPGYEWMYTAEFYAVPSWRVLCLYTSDANKKLTESTYANPGTSLYYESLYINAQTGELLDPTRTGNGTADYTGFISWEDVK